MKKMGGGGGVRGIGETHVRHDIFLKKTDQQFL